MTRERDYAFEALCESTGSDPRAERGKLNAALKSIREQMPEMTDSYLLGAEIHERAKMYRRLMPEVVLTSTALAAHWKRVFEEANTKRGGTNQNAGLGCETCCGDRFVLVSSEPEQYAVCPDCNPADASFTRYDGTRFVLPDPAKVRELMNR